jgi:hypothetical protein
MLCPGSLHQTLVLALAVATLEPSAGDSCLFGSYKCFDGQTQCINLYNTLECTFNAISPIDLDEVIPAFGEVLKAVAPDELDGIIDLGVAEANEVFSDFRDCLKGFNGQEPGCEILQTVHACVSTVSSTAKELKKAGKFGKMVEKNIGKVDDALGIIEDQVLPALDMQCKSGCVNKDSCSSTTETTCGGYSGGGTLAYSPPDGCACLELEAAIENDWGEGTATTAPFCSENLVFRFEDTSIEAGRAYFPEMGCFVGEMEQNGCSDSRYLEFSEITYSYDVTWPSFELDFYYFVPCQDQFGRPYSERFDTPDECTTTSTTSLRSSDTPAGKPNSLVAVTYIVLGTAASWWLTL